MPNTADYLNQLIDDRNDLADNLVTMGVAATHSETFTSLVPKVLTIPSGSNIGYEVTFKVDGNDYYVAQCLQGESITEPPTPTAVAGYFFGSWQSNGVDVTFPYTPSADVELTAHFVAFEQRGWIKSTGAYIDTDIMTDIDDRYEILFDLAENYSNQYLTMCYNGNRASEDYSGVYLFKDSMNFLGGVGGQLKYFNVGSATWAAGNYKITMQNKTATLYLNDVSKGSFTSTGTTQASFGWRLLGGADPYPNRYGNANFKSFKIFDKSTDELKHNIVAGVAGINGGCVCDLVTGTVYYPSSADFEISAT